MEIWTDGSCLGNPGPGAWAFYVPSVPYHNTGFEAKTTNNRMELMAIHKGLEYALTLLTIPGREVHILTDSELSVKILRKEFRGKANLDILEPCLRLASRLRGLGIKVTFIWVRGHSDIGHNDLVDRLANQAARDGARRLE